MGGTIQLIRPDFDAGVDCARGGRELKSRSWRRESTRSTLIRDSLGPPRQKATTRGEVRATHACKWFSSCPADLPAQCRHQSASCKRLKPDPEHSTHQSRPFVLYETPPIPHLLHQPAQENARKMSENYAAPNQQRYLRACMVCSIVMTLAVCDSLFWHLMLSKKVMKLTMPTALPRRGVSQLRRVSPSPRLARPDRQLHLAGL